MDTIQMPFNGWVGKYYVVYMKNEMIFSHKKEWYPSPIQIQTEPEGIMLMELSQIKKN